MLGWISAYRPPARPDTLFVWQVAVHEDARGMGLAGKMLTHIVERPGCEDLRYLTTTITPDNRASFGLFRSFARRMNAEIEESLRFDRERHFRGRHDSEQQLTIGPFGGREADRDEDRSAA